MTDDALFWHRLHSEVGQLMEYAEFRQLLAQVATHPNAAPQVSKSEKHSKVANLKLLRSNGGLPHFLMEVNDAQTERERNTGSIQVY